MNIIITAGGTSENIDNVRKITNMSTGKLGCMIAEEIFKLNKNTNIFYICSSHSIKPKDDDKLKIIIANSVLNVEQSIKEIMSNQKIDYFIHSMAISDYMVDYVTSKELLMENFKEKNNIDEVLNNPRVIDRNCKISSNTDDLIIGLKKSPKIISIIKNLQPKTFLIGFKLLDNVSEEELFNVGFEMLRKNRCNLVLANDLKSIKQGNHTAQIILPEKESYTFIGKESIAHNLVKIMFKRGNCKHIKSLQHNDIFKMDKNIFELFYNTGKYLFENNFLPIVENGTYGNMSVKTENGFIITGRNVNKGKLNENDLCFIRNVKYVDENDIYAYVNSCNKLIKPSIDSAIHHSIYKNTSHKAIIHIHCKEFFKDIPCTDYNYPCGTFEELNSIIKLINQGDIIQLYKHGLIIMGKDFDDCINKLENLFKGIKITDFCIDNDKNHIWKEWENHLIDIDAYNNKKLLNKKMYKAINLNESIIGLLYFDKNDNRIEFAIYTSKIVRNCGLGIGKFVIKYIEKIADIEGINLIQLKTKKVCNVVDFYHNNGFRITKIDENNIIYMSKYK